MKLHKRNKCWLLFLFFLAFPLFADYTITVQNGSQSLFQHPVSVELTAEQTAFVQAGIYLEEVSEDGNNTSDLLDYTLDTTGETPQLRWTLRGETTPAQQRFFRLIDFNAYPPPRRGSNSVTHSKEKAVFHRTSNTARAATPTMNSYSSTASSIPTMVNSGCVWTPRPRHRSC